jgi:hypothetical protein
MGEYLLQNCKGKKIDTEIVAIAQKKWREVKEEAADIGTAVHDWIEQKIKGLEPAIPKNEQVRNGAMAFLKWCQTHKIKFMDIEKIVYSKKYKYVGKCDWVGVEGKMLVIGDHKTSKGIYNEMRYQLAAYWSAVEEETGKKIDKGYIVKFGKEDGEFEVKEISREEYLKDREAFLGLLMLKRREVELNNASKFPF